MVHHWWLNLLYDLVLLAVTGSAWCLGDRPEQLGAVIAVVASAATALAIVISNIIWGIGAVGLWLVDFATLGAFLLLMLGCDRTWTIFASGFQLAAVGLNVAAMLQPTAVIRSYMIVQPVYTYLVLTALLAGTFAARRRRRSERACEGDARPRRVPRRQRPPRGG